jgi:Cu2+-exporting ATPase
MRIAAGLAARSRHPAARAIVDEAARRKDRVPSFDRIEEIPGLGIEALSGTDTYRLGRAGWALGRTDPNLNPSSSVSILSKNGEEVAAFVLQDRLRADAPEVVAELRRQGLSAEIVSGDRETAVRELASRLGIGDFSAGLLPAEKVNLIAAQEAAGRKVLMVGDGLNDAPALAAAHVSMAPATAADIGRNAADFVFLKESLTAVIDALAVSRRSRRLIVQNFALAIGYNALAVPVAVLGYVTPLLAAVAMSLSSIIVVANALRLSTSRTAS